VVGGLISRLGGVLIAFNKLSKFSGAYTPTAGVGDTAYREFSYAVHSLSGCNPRKEKRLKDLATWVAGQM
jgi:hypothetical protein